MKIELVEWYDSCSCNGWIPKKIEEHIDKVVSMGILFREDEDEIELVPNLGTDIKLHPIAIPKGCILRRRQLQLK